MVKAIEWINKNYPENGVCPRKEDKENYGKRREEIVSLDISSQNLEGNLCVPWPGFTNLRKVNISNNKVICGLPGNTDTWEEIDYSHNPHRGDWGSGNFFSQLRKLNLSYNNIERIGLYQAPHLTHLDASGNIITKLDLSKNRALEVLKCSDNPLLDNLTLANSPSLKSFDCFGAKLDKENTIIIPKNNPLTIIAITIPLGLLLLVFITLTFHYRQKYKRSLERQNNGERTRLLDNQQGRAENNQNRTEIPQQEYQAQIEAVPNYQSIPNPSRV